VGSACAAHRELAELKPKASNSANAARLPEDKEDMKTRMEDMKTRMI
jgi:hypothetical protein